jgi:hypothetical protein
MDDLAMLDFVDVATRLLSWQKGLFPTTGISVLTNRAPVALTFIMPIVC